MSVCCGRVDALQFNQVAQNLVESVQRSSQLAGGDAAVHVFRLHKQEEKGTQQVQGAERRSVAKSEEIEIGKV